MSYAQRSGKFSRPDEHACDTDIENTKTFTGQKLDWLSAVSADDSVKPAAFEVAFCIVQHVNARTLIGILSDDVIVEKTGISRAEVERHRKSLRSAGWLIWRRSRTANFYTPLFDNVSAARDVLAAKRQDRLERRAKQANQNTALPSHSAPARDHAPSPVMNGDFSPAMNIHREYYTLEVTPLKKPLSVESSFMKIADPQVAATALLEILGGGDRSLGQKLAKAMGSRRYLFLLNEMLSGTLYPSALTSAAAFGAEVTGLTR